MSACTQSWLVAILAAGHGRRFQLSLATCNTGATAEDKLAARLDNGERVLLQTLRRFDQAARNSARLAVFTRAERVPTYSQWAAAAGLASCIEWQTVGPVAKGIGDTIGAAARWALTTTESFRWLLIALGDMPFIQPASLQRLQLAVAKASSETLAWRLCHRGQPGHPVVFRRELWTALLGLQAEQGARDLLASLSPDRFAAVEVDDPGVVRDVDRYSDLQLIDASGWRRLP